MLASLVAAAPTSLLASGLSRAVLPIRRGGGFVAGLVLSVGAGLESASLLRLASTSPILRKAPRSPSLPSRVTVGSRGSLPGVPSDPNRPPEAASPGAGFLAAEGFGPGVVVRV